MLGVTIDDRMSWKVQSEKVTKSMSSKICMVKRLNIPTITGIGRHLLQNNNSCQHLLYICMGKLPWHCPLKNREAAYHRGQNYPQTTKTCWKWTRFQKIANSFLRYTNIMKIDTALYIQNTFSYKLVGGLCICLKIWLASPKPWPVHRWLCTFLEIAESS